MQIANIKDLNLPSKKEEEFLKIDFASLFDFDFKAHKVLSFDLDLNSVNDTEDYESKLFSIANSFDNNKKVLTIKENLQEPLVIVNNLKVDSTVFTNNLLIEIKSGIKASIIEVFVSNSKDASLFANRTIKLEKDASLEYAKIQDINSSNSMIFSLAVNQKNSSNLEISNFEYGDGFVVNSFENILNSEFANYELNALVKLNKEATTSNLIKTIHNEKNSTSNINYKNSLQEKSKAVVKIKSIVNETALFSKAFQNCNTILLSDDATIFAQPHLEILIDELEASHGTTTGTLNKEQLLYLQSRGISKNEAYEMLLSAFENKIVDNIKDEIIKEFIKTYKREKYV